MANDLTPKHIAKAIAAAWETLRSGRPPGYEGVSVHTFVASSVWVLVGPELERFRAELAEANERAERMTDLSAKYYAERNEALSSAEQAEAAIDNVRKLCELTIAASCRVQAIDQARDTLAVLDHPTDT